MREVPWLDAVQVERLRQPEKENGKLEKMRRLEGVTLQDVKAPTVSNPWQIG